MKIKIAYIFLLLILLGVSSYFYFTESSSTLKNADFAIQDASLLTNIRMFNNKDTINLELIENEWKLDHIYSVEINNLNRCLRALTLLEVKAPVLKSKSDSIIQILKEKGVKVCLNNKTNLLKSYYVYENQKSGITYMLMADSNRPIIVEIPGYNESISVLYSLDKKFWQSNIILSLKPNQIKSISVKHLNNPNSSFSISKKLDEVILRNNLGEIISDINWESFNQYLGYFLSVTCKEWVRESKEINIESFNSRYSEHEIIIELVNNNEIVLRTYSIPQSDSGIEIAYGFDNMFVMVNEESLAIVDMIEFDLLLKEIGYFTN